MKTEGNESLRKVETRPIVKRRKRSIARVAEAVRRLTARSGEREQLTESQTLRLSEHALSR